MELNIQIMIIYQTLTIYQRVIGGGIVHIKESGVMLLVQHL